MSVVVREMLALFVAKVQDGSFNAIENRIARLQHAAIGLAASFGATQLFQMAEEAARFEDARAVFKAAGGDLELLRKQTRGIVSDFALIKSFNFTQQFGIGEHLGEFFNIANAASKKFGYTKEQALEYVTKGVALGSTQRLKWIGASLQGDLRKQAKDAYAAVLGKNSGDLTHNEVIEAYARSVIAQTKKMVAEVGEIGTAKQDVFARFAASVKNLKMELGGLIETGLPRLLAGLTSFGDHLGAVFRRLKDDPNFIASVESAVDAVEYIARGALTLWRDAVTVYEMLPVKTGLVVAGLWKWRAALMAVSAASTAALTLGGAQWALIAFLSSGVVAAAATTAALVGLTAIAAIAVEEVAAVFDPDVDGFFETWSLNWGALEEQVTAKLDTDTGLAAFLDYCLYAIIDLEKKIVDIMGWVLNLDEQGDALSPFMAGPFTIGDSSGPHGADTGAMADYMNGMLDSQKKEFLARVNFGQNVPDAAYDVGRAFSEDDAAWHFQQYLDSHPARRNEMGAANDNNAYAPHVYSPTVHVTVNGAAGADADQMSMMIRSTVEEVLEDHVQEMSLSLRPGVP